jgi:hypothetical protein
MINFLAGNIINNEQNLNAVSSMQPIDVYRRDISSESSEDDSGSRSSKRGGGDKISSSENSKGYSRQKSGGLSNIVNGMVPVKPKRRGAVIDQSKTSNDQVSIHVLICS